MRSLAFEVEHSPLSLPLEQLIAVHALAAAVVVAAAHTVAAQLAVHTLEVERSSQW